MLTCGNRVSMSFGGKRFSGGKRVARYKSSGFLRLLLGSPFAFLGLIFLLKGKVGVGLPFLLLGLASVGSGAVAGRKADPPAGDPGTELGPGSGGEHAEPGAAAEGGGM